MEHYNFYLNGKSAEDVGIILQSSPQLSAPIPNVTSITVPGRNGVLHIYDNSYANRTMKIKAYVYSDSGNVKSSFDAVNSFLFGSSGYVELNTSDDESHFMQARISNGADVSARVNKIAPFELKFDCKPQRFLYSGKYAITLEDNSISGDDDISAIHLTNPTGFTSFPLITIYPETDGASGTAEIHINKSTLVLSDDTTITDPIIYDTETHNAYYGNKNMNYAITAKDDISLAPGDNSIYVIGKGAVTRVDITPRWWEL